VQSRIAAAGAPAAALENSGGGGDLALDQRLAKLMTGKSWAGGAVAVCFHQIGYLFGVR
jgi:hypothetical protein